MAAGVVDRTLLILGRGTAQTVNRRVFTAFCTVQSHAGPFVVEKVALGRNFASLILPVLPYLSSFAEH